MNIENPFEFSSKPTILLRQIASIEALYQAWRKVRANRGAAGIDAVSLREFERHLQANLSELSRNLLNKTYEPLPVRQVQIPKADGKQRELAIPTVRDRIAQRAVLDVVEPIFEPLFLDCSFAFRPSRSVAMAIQRLVVARAQGFLWTVESDIKDFFPAIDHKLLLADISAIIGDKDLLALIKQWLDAGVLEAEEGKANWLTGLHSYLAGAHLTVRDGIDGLLSDFVSNRLGVAGMQNDFEAYAEETSESVVEANNTSAHEEIRRTAVRKLVQDGVLLALAERAAIRGVTSAKFLGIGGAALALAAVAPTAVRATKKLLERKAGASQGSPISPLLSNIYLHPFDVALSMQGNKLTRYCDDFVILCRNEVEARAALQTAETALKDRRLQLNKEKTRIVAPGGEFDFLGYHFTADGKVIAPPSTTDALAQQVVQLAASKMKRVKFEIAATPEKTKSLLEKLKSLVGSRH
jgi:RNA-directed DNA polymerase